MPRSSKETSSTASSASAPAEQANQQPAVTKSSKKQATKELEKKVVESVMATTSATTVPVIAVQEKKKSSGKKKVAATTPVAVESLQQSSEPIAVNEPLQQPVVAQSNENVVVAESQEQQPATLEEKSNVETCCENADTMCANIQDLLRKTLSGMHAFNSTVVAFKRAYQKENKKVQKKEHKPKSSGNPSGFAKPGYVSNELCDFLGVPYGSLVARTEVTRSVINYIASNNLRDASNKRIIVPDEKLKVLLAVDSNVEFTYFHLQKYLKKHFVKSS